MAASRKISNAGSRGATIPLLPLRDGVLFPGVIHTLHIARESTKRAIRIASDADGRVFCVSQRDGRIEEPAHIDLFEVGVVCEVLQASPLPDGSLRAILRPLHRAKIAAFSRRSGKISARADRLEEVNGGSEASEAIARECSRQFQRLAESNSAIPPESVGALSHAQSPSAQSDLIAYHLPISIIKKQAILEQLDVGCRLDALLLEMAREIRLLSIQRDVAHHVDSAFDETQREFFLREQLKAIRIELGDSDSDSEEDHWRERIIKASMPEAAAERALEHVSKLDRFPIGTPEGASLRDYLDWLVGMPWGKSVETPIQISEAAAILDSRHDGIDAVKDRILEHLAIRKLSQGIRGPILCFVGPPGVGKSSAVASIAEAMGRKLVRIALGGLRDEAEIRGHRRTYVGAMPGRILKEIRACGVNNPVILLDEIDKMSRDWRGDPAGALLEALDPMMNDAFVDHYLEVPFSLRDVVFVATANTIEGILPALYDRLEIVEFSSYTQGERRAILERHVVPAQLVAHGLSASDIQFESAALDALVKDYSWEPGVRQLSQKAEAVCRKAARRIAEGVATPIVIGVTEIESWLGPADSWLVGALPNRQGRCLGLAVSAMGGMAMPIEAALLEPAGPQPSILVTGNPGDVMKESVYAAMTFIRQNSVKLGIECFAAKDVHVHVGEGSIPKDGPSAGLPMAVALISTALGRPIIESLAASGEIGILGDVRPVGGIREKLIAASRERLKTVILPSRNASEVEALPDELKRGTTIQFVDTVFDAIRLALKLPDVEGSNPKLESQKAKQRTATRHTN